MTPPLLTARHCLFLDLDGTLADIAPRPELARVEDAMKDEIARLAPLLDGALAIVSGRPLHEIDAMIGPLDLPAAGIHGAERRAGKGSEPVTLAVPEELAALVLKLEDFARANDGLSVEKKGHAVALHFRARPELEIAVHQMMEEAAGSAPGLTLMKGKMVMEAKPRAATKGAAVEAFMALAPFKNRLPVFAGDDVTDEDGFRAAAAHRGFGIKIGEGESAAAHRLASPQALRQWIGRSIIELEKG